MSRDNQKREGSNGYCTPSLAADLFATFVGLALVYGMIALVGNGQPVKPARAATAGHEMARDKTGHDNRQMAKNEAPSAGPEQSGGRTGPVDLKTLARGQLAAFAVYNTPKELPAFTFVDEKGKKHSLKELRGKVVLLNLWATWCGPCRHEMPWLDQLKYKYRNAPFEMLTISIDRGGLKKPRRFFNQIGVKHLTLYGDPTGRLAAKLRAFGMPTTLLIDPEGRELGRIAGPAEWNSADAIAFIDAALANAKRSPK